MPLRRIPFQPGKFYHISSHGVGSEKIFRNADNYRYFLDKLRTKIGGLCDLFAWCLVPDRLQLVVQVKHKDEILHLRKKDVEILKRKRIIKNKKNQEYVIIDQLVVTAFALSLNAYSQAYNKAFSRKGALFRESFHRELVNESKLPELVCAVHNHPLKTELCHDPEGWHFSSYSKMLEEFDISEKGSLASRIFNGRSGFIDMHKNCK